MPGKKQDNRRVYPNATRQPRHLDSFRKSEATARQETYDKLTLQEKIDRLPSTGATKQRARLQYLLEKKNSPEQKFKAAVTEGLKDAEEGKTVPHEEVKRKIQKKYMKGAK